MKFDKYVLGLGILFVLVTLGMYSILSKNADAPSSSLFDDSFDTSDETEQVKSADVEKIVVGDDGIESITYKETTEEKKEEQSSSPTPPKGFTWQKCSAMKAEFLKPEGWYFKEETSSSGSKACFITKERITTSSGFQTGLSVNAVQNISNGGTETPQMFMEAYLEEITNSFDDYDPFDTFRPAGTPFIGLSSTMTKSDLTVYYLLYYNTDTDTLYVISFESPTDEWKEAFPKGKTILEKLGFSRSY